MNHDYWGPATEEEIRAEQLQKKYKEKVENMLNRNAGYFKANELRKLFSLDYHLSEYDMKVIDEIDFLSRNRDLGGS